MLVPFTKDAFWTRHEVNVQGLVGQCRVDRDQRLSQNGGKRWVRERKRSMQARGVFLCAACLCAQAHHSVQVCASTTHVQVCASTTHVQMCARTCCTLHCMHAFACKRCVLVHCMYAFAYVQQATGYTRIGSINNQIYICSLQACVTCKCRSYSASMRCMQVQWFVCTTCKSTYIHCKHALHASAGSVNGFEHEIIR